MVQETLENKSTRISIDSRVLPKDDVQKHKIIKMSPEQENTAEPNKYKTKNTRESN